MLNEQDREKYKLNRGYNTKITGCNKRCPCRSWINCPAYVDITEQQQRLKRKSDGTWNGINKWYEANFRLKYETVDSMGNG